MKSSKILILCSEFIDSDSDAKETQKITFLTTEQYMMYHKALLFADTAIAAKILREPEPKKQKALGRKVKGFDPRVWDERKEAIVEEGNWWKFTNVKGLVFSLLFYFIVDVLIYSTVHDGMVGKWDLANKLNMMAGSQNQGRKIPSQEIHI